MNDLDKNCPSTPPQTESVPTLKATAAFTPEGQLSVNITHVSGGPTPAVVADQLRSENRIVTIDPGAKGSLHTNPKTSLNALGTWLRNG